MWISSPDAKVKSSATESFNTRAQDLIRYFCHSALYYFKLLLLFLHGTSFFPHLTFTSCTSLGTYFHWVESFHHHHSLTKCQISWCNWCIARIGVVWEWWCILASFQPVLFPPIQGHIWSKSSYGGAQSSINKVHLQSFWKVPLNLAFELPKWIWAVGVVLCWRNVACEERQTQSDEALWKSAVFPPSLPQAMFHLVRPAAPAHRSHPLTQS